MISTVLIVFFLFLILGMPIAHTVLMAATIGAYTSNVDASIIVNQLYSGLNSFTLLAVPFFIIAGNLAAKGRTSKGILDTMNAFLGHLKGGLGIATIFACVFFGAVTGSAIATVVAIGSIMFPKLIEKGYPKGLSLGIITASGTLGVMIPPSISMLLVAVALGTSVSKQFMAGFIPGIITAIGFSVWVWFVAKKRNTPVDTRMSWKNRLITVRNSIGGLFFPVIILGGIYSGIATPTEAAVVSVFYVLILELFVYKSLTFKEVYDSIRSSVISASVLTLTIGAAKVFVWYMTTQKIPTKAFNWITANVSSPYTLWIAICIMLLIAGCFVDVSNVVIILGPILVPVLNYFNIDLINFCIVSILLAQFGYISPPFGICLFVTMKVGAASLVEVVKGSLPFLIIMLLVTALLIAFPQISLFLPNLMA